ncbi:DUF2087 domain-containing protein [Rhodobacterales bacterium HKCCE2091]|nr:DUF2087 domain-containing protein [Rhodobacterales bacterium HKCCE2091]
MARDDLALYIADLPGFAKSLRGQLSEAGALPSHQAFLGLVAKAAGYRNFQALKADLGAEAPKGSDRVARALRVFDGAGRMTRWPSQTAVQALCMWVVWHRLPAQVEMTEPEINGYLRDAQDFGDHVILRRSLIDHGLVSRHRDGTHYRRIEQAPPEEARALLRAVMKRG